MRKIIPTLFVALFLFSLFSFAGLASAEQLEINYFYSPGCSACVQMGPFLESMEQEYNIVLNAYESSRNRNAFIENLEKYGVPEDRRGFIPAVFIKDNYFIGYSSDITKAIEDIILGEEQESVFGGDVVETKILGFWDVKVSFKDRSLIGSTILLGFLDSLNVCSITVLIFLIVYSLSIGSLKRAFKLGLIFTAVIYLFYFFFMFALTAFISSIITNYGFQIKLAVIFLSLFAGILLIKDYFFYGKWISLKVPSSAKPLLEKYIKQGTIISTIIFGILASLVELPCTAIFPLIYSTILAEAGVFGAARITWIALYNLIYVLPLLLIVFGTYFSWTKIKEVDDEVQKLKKILKLVAGVALVAIAVYFAWPLVF